MNEFRPLRPDADADAGDGVVEISRLWATALQPMHGAGCGCCSSRSFVLQPEHLEEDILLYLAGRHQEDERARLVLRKRIDDPDGPFLESINRLSNEPLPPGTVAALRRDIRATLASLSEVARRAPRPFGSTWQGKLA